MYNIYLEELKCLENITNTQSTYFIINLKLSKLFIGILKEGKNGTIPILETRILLQSLTKVPFIDEKDGLQVLMDLTNCIESHWYSLQNTWNWKTIIKELKILKKYVLEDYLISGSIIIYDDDYIQWNLNISNIST